MSLRPDSVGLTTQPRTVHWTDRETLLYALGVGAGVDELDLTTENSHGMEQRVLPTFGVIVCSGLKLLSQIGTLNWGSLLHGGQSVTAYSPLPSAGTLSVVGEVTGLQDKGAGRNAVVELTARGSDPKTGLTIVETVTTLVLRGQGGFGGANASRAPGAPEPPDRDPDRLVTQSVRLDQALLYRLSGDRNPLHSDPWFAREKAGFAKPILHGLCTFGIAGLAVVRSLCVGDPRRLRTIATRFSAPVFPGDELVTSIWRQDEVRAVFRTQALGEQGTRVVLEGGYIETTPPEGGTSNC